MKAQGLPNSNRATSLMGVAALAVAAFASLAPTLARAGASDDLESLGGNAAVENRAGKLSSSNRSAIVQGRTVDRNNRVEFGTYYGPVMAGNSYLSTQNWGGQVEYHFVPQFSLGVRYEQMFNSLTNEGKSAMDLAKSQQAAGNSYAYPDVDYPDHSIIGTATWYMFYGKLNFFDLRTVQFDVYSLGGYGQMTTSRNVSPTWTAGGGIGFWITQHITSRLELRYQNYQDKPYSGTRDLNLIVANFGLGVLL